MRQQKRSGDKTEYARHHEPGRVLAFYPHMSCRTARSCKSSMYVLLEGQCARPSESKLEDERYRQLF